MAPRVRFAPSPTGYLHVGGARTALFNWLFARRHGGVFVLRIEDTDVERSSAEMVDGILAGLRWLGLNWDEGPQVGGPFGPYFQSERLDRHQAMAARLVAGGSAYYCYCTPDELKGKREAAGGTSIYDRTCLRLTTDEMARRERDRMPRAMRFKVPSGEVRFDDLVHGSIEVDAVTIEDFVIVRSDGHPTYQLSVVSDDVEMKITHVVRGDDHISNTPKQILLYRALGAPIPQFAHVPLILGPDKKRLSKRHGATSVMEYAQQGYLPEAMVNFLALLGWSPGSGNQELFTRDELARVFALEGISGGNAVFGPEKLDWFNQQYIMRLASDELAKRIQPSFEAAGLWDVSLLGDRRRWFFSVLDLLKPRAKRIGDFAAQARYFLTDRIEYDHAAVEKHVRAAGMGQHLLALDAAFGELSAFDAASLEAALRAVADLRGIKAAALIHATRVAVTGTSVSPGLFEVLVLVGCDRVHARLQAALRLIAPAPG
ncbi:MAG: glutamate--tRNA ligase [Acidobacteria bacterium RIFCSPLOWO2_12_FULL_65_11]|nr:MAG: glutamate--tRNA ligase [Acidobacteria bacterium RIFCSPLOWO2_02_FULL_64_15]OFW31579.1 MAG: glutamate--tRNA ligase [Acidobacteria bacterium RIFCSPLOWO2_12_FULL_65_11]